MITGAAEPIGHELWGGIECTVNRVRDAYHDQVERTGHGARPCDIGRLAALGVTALRYPVLWERTARGGRLDFGWADERLAELRRLGIRPIIGLVHHGSGPPGTSLLDPGFADGLSEFARAVAERYPWVTEYTPVNEPLTTARFSALYGHWYPHRRSGRAFVRAVLVQCRAVALAMRAIRAVTPGARLVQTEDLGRTYSTPLLAYQADHENHRRLLGIDLLSGEVDARHPLHGYLLDMGADPRDIAWFRDEPCPPDVIGVNYYVTSDRFLDERIDRYPASTHGGNGRHRYADVEAVRVRKEGLLGHASLLLGLYRRYRRPIAITEAHLAGPCEEQIRWLLEAWRAAHTARMLGACIQSVTAWSLLGAFDWDCLVVAPRGRYEAGAYDVRASPPQPTELADLLRSLGRGDPGRPALCAAPGWWRRPERFAFPAVSVEDGESAVHSGRVFQT